MISKTIFFVLFLFAGKNINCQEANLAIAVLDLTIANNESNDAQLISANHMVNLIGMPYIITDDLNQAIKCRLILCSSKIKNNTFSDEEIEVLKSFVNNGGSIISPRVEDQDLFALFGIKSQVQAFDRLEMFWNSDLDIDHFSWLDEAKEKVVSFGGVTQGQTFKTVGYELETAIPLAIYRDGTIAVSQNSFGSGHAIAIGFSWKEVILRNQINRDAEAGRTYSNGFEPSSDVFSMFIRSIYTAHNRFSIWKHTSPANSSSTVIVTHDIDSSSGIDTSIVFSTYEKENDIKATYNVTVRYFDDFIANAFYLMQQSKLKKLVEAGHSIGSHSVGHFYDFADSDAFPCGEIGNTIENYKPYNNGTFTTGGSIFGECELSKSILESDLDVKVNVFRAGHLAYPDSLITVLDELGYSFNSTYSANDVLTHFPYRNVKNRSFNGELSNLYEIPVTISDVFPNDPISSLNYSDKVKIWTDVTLKNNANNAPTVLLIHPNRVYKRDALKDYINTLPNTIKYMEMGQFGAFWKSREALMFNSKVNDNSMIVQLENDEYLTNNSSFIVKDGQALSSIIVLDSQGRQLNFDSQNWNQNDLILFAATLTTVDDKQDLIPSSQLEIYPNPSNGGLINIDFNLNKNNSIEINLFDLSGRNIRTLFKDNLISGQHKITTNVNGLDIREGAYFIVLKTNNQVITRKYFYM